MQEIDNKKNMNENDSYLKTLISCKRCNLPGITHGFDIYECQKCGDMLETAIDQHAEWRHYGGDGKPDPAIEFTIQSPQVLNRISHSLKSANTSIFSQGGSFTRLDAGIVPQGVSWIN